MRDCDKNKKSSFLKYWNVSNLYGWAMSETLPVNDSKDISLFNEDFIKSYNDESEEGYFVEADVHI